MMDNENKNSDANLVEIEADSSGSPAEDTPQSERTLEESSKGGGFVWLLAVFLVIGGGGYAVWPYVAPEVDPAIKDARAILGLETRPTQPSLPGSLQIERTQPAHPTASVDSTVSAPASELRSADATLENRLPSEPVVPALSDQQPSYAPDRAPQGLVRQAPPSTDQPILDMHPSAPSNATSQQALGQSGETVSGVVPMVQSLTDRLNLLEAQLLTAASEGAAGENRAAMAVTGDLVRTLSELKADLATLKTRVAVLESTPRTQIDPSASAQALVLSVTQLGSATESDRPFITELDAMARIGGAQPVVAAAVQRLSTYSGAGAPTQSALTAQFKNVAVSVMKAHGATQRHGWWDEVVGAASSLVTIRQTDPTRIEDPIERALAVAEIALHDNDLKTALAALDTIQGAEGTAARSWRDSARARVEVREAMDILHNYALTALAATGGA